MVQPDGRVTSTLQLTEASILAEQTGVTTISNFRARDIAVGGQGAPMTAYADWLLLRHESHWRAVQNIGGIGNVTFLPPLSAADSQPLAFDTGPGNVLIDAATMILTDGQQTYDRDGALAAKGWVNEDWLKELSQHPYYALKPPKTTGRELFSVAMAQKLVAVGKSRGLDDASIVATLTRLTAWSIADSTRRFAPLKPAEFIIGGGGRHNPTLLAMLRAELPGMRVLAHENIGFNSDSKEALVFALLAYETWHGRPGNLPALTGAEKSVILGQITPGENYPNLIRRTWC
jgi:anhydro-N-acetylmuramic acid kinase